MKTTLNLSDSLLAQAKALAARQRTSLTRVIEEGLRLRLLTQKAGSKSARVRLPVFRGKGGLVEGIDPLSNKALLRAAEDDDA
ncbi:MAG: DUF2191 domain-containing protein [Gammaproteobacteria bacterium]|nr:DUF2191 domain-containing protein [Gammaproteobacteria bacterium]